MITLRYFGHSFWGVFTPQYRVVIDPFDDIGYPMPRNLQADHVIISHEHHDHNNVSLIHGSPIVSRVSREEKLTHCSLILHASFHDEAGGTKRGRNNIIQLTMEGITIVHCGDLGQIPDEATLQKLGHPDILLLPVGEVYTMPISEARQLVSRLKPRLVFPMHFQTPALGFKLGRYEEFTKYYDNVTIHNSNTIDITPELLSGDRTIIMNWEGED